MSKPQLLPGVTSPEIKELHDACEDLLDARDKLNVQRKHVDDLHENVGKVLRKHNLPGKRYKHGGVKAWISTTEKVKVERYSKKETKA